MTEYNIKTLRSVYIQNLPYKYPLPTYYWKQGGMFFHPVATGWQVIPNILWGHFASPRQFYEMVIKFEAIKVVGVECTMFNMIPIQTQLAIQGTSTFNAFNNTIYAWGYTDDLYETPPFNWFDYYDYDNQLYVAYKEGAFPRQTNNTDTDTTNTSAWWTEGNAGMPRVTVGGEPTELDKYITLMRQRLPQFYYSFPFNKGYDWTPPVGSSVNKNDVNMDMQLMFGGARNSGFTGAFWDPLNRPDNIMELRPGKNAIRFSWNAHPTDSNHWFNTDAVALQWPVPRDSSQNPRLFSPWDGNVGFNEWQPAMVDPRAPGNHAVDPSKRTQSYSKNAGGALFNQVINNHMTYPYDYESLPNWSDLPIVPVNWFKKEIQNSNPWTYKTYEVDTQGCQTSAQQSEQDARTTFCRKVYQEMWDLAYPGTEYEQYKYPPTQWFTKMVPLFDAHNTIISLEAQVFLEFNLKIIGKERKSAIFAPTWGPWPPQNLYAADPQGKFNLSTIRGRSGGARRTWLNPCHPGETPIPGFWLKGSNTPPYMPNESAPPANIGLKPPTSVTQVQSGSVPSWIEPTRQQTMTTSTVTDIPHQQ